MNNQVNTNALVADLKNVVRDSEQLLEEVADVTGDRAEAMRRRLTETVTAARETCCKLEAQAKERLKVADKTIRDHPYQSIGFALAAGLILGALVARK